MRVEINGSVEVFRYPSQPLPFIISADREFLDVAELTKLSRKNRNKKLYKD